MKRFLFSFIFLCYSAINVIAQSHKEPIVVKSIISDNSQLQLSNQYVVAEIFKNNIYVECTYNIKNTGEKTTANISLPYFKLSYNSKYLFNLADINNIDIWVNNYKIRHSRISLDATLKEILDNRDIKKLSKHEQKNNAMFTWQTNFKQNESVQITIRYNLPINRNLPLQQFKYYSLIKGFKGKIEESEIKLITRNIAKSEIKNVTPKKDLAEINNTFLWRNNNVSKSNNNIYELTFELFKNQESNLANNVNYYLNNKKISSKKANQLEKNNIAFVKRTENSKDKNVETYSFYSKDFIVESFTKKTENRFPETKSLLKNANNIIVRIDGVRHNKQKAYQMLDNLKTEEIKTLEIIESKNGAIELNILLGKYQSFEI